jgi:hypothetical protein
MFTALRMDLQGMDKVEVEHRLYGVAGWRLDAELRCVAGAGGWKDREYHSMFISRNVGLRD